MCGYGENNFAKIQVFLLTFHHFFDVSSLVNCALAQLFQAIFDAEFEFNKENRIQGNLACTISGVRCYLVDDLRFY